MSVAELEALRLDMSSQGPGLQDADQKNELSFQMSVSI